MTNKFGIYVINSKFELKFPHKTRKHVTFSFIYNLYIGTALINVTAMKKLTFLYIAFFSMGAAYAQKTIKKPYRSVLLQQKNQPPSPAKPAKINTDQLITKGTYSGKTETTTFQPNYGAKKGNPESATANNANNLGGLTDGGSLLNNNTSNNNSNNTLGSLTDMPSLTSHSPALTKNNTAQPSNTSLEPLVPLTTKINTNNTTSNQKSIETVDPKLMGSQSFTGTYKNVNGTTMPPLSPLNVNDNNGKSSSGDNKTDNIERRRATAGSKTVMPELAPIEGSSAASQANKSGMPELAPIEGQTNLNKSKSAMPELAPIGDENTGSGNYSGNNNEGKINTNLRGYYMPRGTSMVAKPGLSFVMKPGIPTSDPAEEKNKNEESNYVKPSAGGGMGMPALAPIETEATPKKEAMPELATIENTAVTSSTPVMPELGVIETNNQNIAAPVNNEFALAPIEPQTSQYQTQQQQQYQQQGLQRYQTQPQTYNYNANQPVTAKKTVTPPCKHVHAANCPCCNAKKKYIPRKRTYRRPVVYRQPTVIAYQQDPQQTRANERIVYVPVQPQQQQQQYQYQNPQQVAKPQQKVVYKDYTNTYTKPTTQPQPCNCGGTTQAQAPSPAVNKEGKRYYNPTNYSPSLISGPTSGDYPMASSQSDINMRYGFYLNQRGKYGVSLYNDYCTVLLSQNGKILEYRINGDPSLDPNTYKPKLNYFGSPESVAGIPIEYNYNRSVHKMGNIKFDYDFEGFFKSVGDSKVNYTSRSSLQSVDGVTVHYDAQGNVTSVDPNNGLINFNPQ